MGKPLEVEILGHKAKITNIKGRLADPSGAMRMGSPPEDEILVWVDFGRSSLGNIKVAAISLPVDSYNKASLLNAVKRHGEKQLGESLERHERMQADAQKKKRKQNALDLLIRGINVAVGLEE